MNFTLRTFLSLAAALTVGAGLIGCNGASPAGGGSSGQDAAATGITGTIQTDTTGLIVAKSPYDVLSTLDRVRDAAGAKGWRIVSNMTFTPNEKENMNLKDIRMLFLVNTDADAVLVHKAPTMAIELPRRILSWQDAAGGVYIAFHDEREMAVRHGIKADDPIVQLLVDGLRDIVNESLAYDEETSRRATESAAVAAPEAGTAVAPGAEGAGGAAGVTATP